MGLRRSLRKLLGYKEPEPFLNSSFSQEGEDLVLGRIFERHGPGFFVDVGALHPLRFSNTYKFYKAGWRGINIDAMPGSMKLFNDQRPSDINLEIPVSDKNEVIPYYIFNEPALNTLSKQLADERNGVDHYVIEKVVEIETQTLGDILKKHLPKEQPIDFLTIDAEGFDMQILRSNNWELFKPSIVLVESDVALVELNGSELGQFMASKGYEVYAKTVKTFFFKLTSFNI
jgi:hypothetical protein